MTIAFPPIATEASPARAREAALIAHCVRVARGQDAAMELADAQVLALAASLLQHRHPEAAHALSAAADLEDIASLVAAGLTDAAAIGQRAREAATAYIGNPADIRHKIALAVELAEAAGRR